MRPELAAGNHSLRITYVAATDSDGRGTYGILLVEGATFSEGGTAKNGEVAGLGNYHEFGIVVL